MEPSINEAAQSSKKPDLLQIQINITRNTLLWGFVGVVLCASVYQVVSETFTMTAYYPSPYGIYSQLISTKDSYFARDAGSVGIGTNAPVAKLDVNGTSRLNGATNIVGAATLSSNLTVGGTASITSNLSVGGPVQLASLSADPLGGKAGMIYYNTASNTIRLFANGAWGPLGVSSSSGQITIVPGTTCPSGSTAVSYYWEARTCTSVTSEYFCGKWFPSQNCGACTTQAGWSTYPASCTYPGTGLVPAGSSYWAVICPNATVCSGDRTCTATTATQVKCASN